MKKGKYLGIIVLIILAIPLCLLLMRNPKESTSKKPAKEETENVMVITGQEANESLPSGVFKKQKSGKTEASDAKQLGGSETLEIIKPSNESEDEVPDESNPSDIHWLSGIW